MDLRGHGDSPPAHEPPTPVDFAEDLKQTLAPMRIDLLVGHSLGAVAAMALVAEQPDAACNVVLEEPPGTKTVSFRDAAARIEEDAARAHADPERAIAVLRTNAPRWDAADCRTAVADLRRCDLRLAAASLRHGKQWRTTELATRLRVSTLVLLAPDGEGRYDGSELSGSSLRGDDRQAFLNAIPNGRSVVLAGGHCLHRDAPDTWLAAVRAFVSSSTDAAKQGV